MEKQKRSISERINARFSEPDDAIFKDGKWRWWFALVFGLSLGSAIVTALIFSGSLGALAIGMGILVLWTLVGTLVYSDSRDARLARGVSILDSIALCFVVTHFCFAMWVYGHLLELRKSDARYEAAALAYNARQEAIQADNAKIAASAERIAEANVKRARLENDTAYQQRRAAEAGLRVRGARNQGSGQFPALSTAPIELAKPKAPDESSAAFLSRWDAWIRLANFGELILAAVTLIYIRNRSAAFNSKNAATASQRAGIAITATVPALSLRGERIATAVATDDRAPALAILRDQLKVVASYLPGRWFKADLIKGGVLIRLCERRQGRELTIAETRQSNKLLNAVNRSDFRERLIVELKRQNFPIGG